jgi:hypothetical protein
MEGAADLGVQSALRCSMHWCREILALQRHTRSTDEIYRGQYARSTRHTAGAACRPPVSDGRPASIVLQLQYI